MYLLTYYLSPIFWDIGLSGSDVASDKFFFDNVLCAEWIVFKAWFRLEAFSWCKQNHQVSSPPRNILENSKRSNNRVKDTHIIINYIDLLAKKFDLRYLPFIWLLASFSTTIDAQRSSISWLTQATIPSAISDWTKLCNENGIILKYGRSQNNIK